MKPKNFAVVAMTAVIAMGLAGCQTETPVVGTDPYAEGKEARMGLSFTVPTSSTPTRAVQDGTAQAAIEGESTINTVDVYIFKSTGVKAVEGAHTRLSLADFTEAPAGTYTLNGDKLIKTLSGDKRVYVGANLGNTFNAEFANESALLATTTNVDALTPGGEGSIYDEEEFLMFGNAAAVATFGAWEESDPASVTAVSLELERVAAKVVVTAAGPDIHNSVTDTWGGDIEYSWNGEYTVTWEENLEYDAADYEGLEINYTFWGYRPVQNARQTYVAPNFLSDAEAAGLPFYPSQNYTGKIKPYAPWNGTLWTLAENTSRYENFAASVGEPNSQRAVYTSSTPVTDPNTLAPYWYYIGGNRDYITPSANGKTTYMMVSTNITVNKTAVYDKGPDGIFNSGTDVGIKYVDYSVFGNGAVYGGADNNVYIVKALRGDNTGKVYITANLDWDEDDIPDGQLIRRRIALDAGWDGVEGGPTGNEEDYAKIYEYPYGFVHFPIFLDGYASTHVPDRYGVFRNQFLHVNITGILGEPGAFPGYPGDYGGDPEVDPTDPTDPDNPWPRTPEDPVDGEPAMLQVEFEVQPWYYLIKDDTILQ